MITPIASGIYAVGHIDWAVRDFHGYETDRATTYNSYLLQFEKTAVIDGVKAPFAAQWLATLREQTALEKIDYIVVNHAEPDHSGALPTLVAAAPQAQRPADATPDAAMLPRRTATRARSVPSPARD